MKNFKRGEIIYYIDLLGRKIDAHTDAFLDRIEALHHRNSAQVEYIEHMFLDPLNYQIKYLINKLLSLLET